MKQKELESIEVDCLLRWNNNEDYTYKVTKKVSLGNTHCRVNLINIKDNRVFINYNISLDDIVKIIKPQFISSCIKANQCWKLESLEDKDLVRIFTLNYIDETFEGEDIWTTRNDSSFSTDGNGTSSISSVCWKTPTRWKMTLLADSTEEREDYSVTYFKKAIEQTLANERRVCTCPEDHTHNSRGCITGMCSCRIQPETKIIPVIDKGHIFDKYSQQVGSVPGHRYTACIDCGLTEGSFRENGSKQVCQPDPDWRNLQEKQFAFYMEEAYKVRKMNE